MSVSCRLFLHPGKKFQVSNKLDCCACHDDNDDVHAKVAAIVSATAAANVNVSARLCFRIKERRRR